MRSPQPKAEHQIPKEQLDALDWSIDQRQEGLLQAKHGVLVSDGRLGLGWLGRLKTQTKKASSKSSKQKTIKQKTIQTTPLNKPQTKNTRPTKRSAEVFLPFFVLRAQCLSHHHLLPRQRGNSDLHRSLTESKTAQTEGTWSLQLLLWESEVSTLLGLLQLGGESWSSETTSHLEVIYVVMGQFMDLS